MCGKDFYSAIFVVFIAGSPPHVRERRPKTEVQTKDYRITPACAGKTYVQCTCDDIGRDHPRMCGKDASHSLAVPVNPGSPPHVRERQG